MEFEKLITVRSILTSNLRYLKRWLNILCNTEEYYAKFVNSYMDITDLEYSMFEFRNYLKHIGRGQDITIGQLQESIKVRDKTELKALLEELLLIPVDNKEIMKVLKIKSYAELQDFIDKTKVYSNNRYAGVIHEYFYYNKAG